MYLERQCSGSHKSELERLPDLLLPVNGELPPGINDGVTLLLKRENLPSGSYGLADGSLSRKPVTHIGGQTSSKNPGAKTGE